MSVLKHDDQTRLNTQHVGYINRRTGHILCLNHGGCDTESPRSPWAALRLLNPLQTAYASTTPVICHDCGAWLNDGSTGYAIPFSHDNRWRRRVLPRLRTDPPL
jgi:hypothetical protein